MEQHTFSSFAPAELPASTLYDLLVSAIQPRPIALVSTVNADGLRNLAPFSFFMFGGTRPPSVAFCPANRSDGTPKDTLRFIEETEEWTINLVHRALAEQMVKTGVDVPAEVDEWDLSGLTSIPGVKVQSARIAESPVQLECKLHQIVRHGTGPHGTNYVIGEIVHAHFSNRLWDGGTVEPNRFRMVGRLGGTEYVDVANAEVFHLERPKAPPPSSVP